jgi:hypothetical protein
MVAIKYNSGSANIAGLCVTIEPKSIRLIFIKSVDKFDNNPPTSLCAISRETVRRLMVPFHMSGHISLNMTEDYFNPYLKFGCFLIGDL